MRHSVGLTDPTTADATALARRSLGELICGQVSSAADALIELAASSDPSTAAAASRVLFRDIVEALADSFQPTHSAIYRDFFARLIELVRRKPGFEEFDESLSQLGVGSTQDLLRRADTPPPGRSDLCGVQRILIPSRVTLGADIAVVSVILAGLRQRFPAAEIVFVGGPKNNDLFAGAPGLRTVAAPYPRGGALRERLAVWPQLLRIALDERSAVAAGGLLIVDPDSRMTQLGLLPLGGDDELRLHFDSRAAGGTTPMPLARLATVWLDQSLGEADQPTLPWTTFQPMEWPAEARPLAAVSFGLGGNPAKRVSAAFEANVVKALLGRGYRIALDCGLGEEEYARVAALAGRVERAGGLVHQGSFRSFGEIVTTADLFVGYDSSFGHLAAAMGTRGVTIFAGAVSERMRQRWTPSGRGRSSVIDVAPDETDASVLARFERELP